MGEAVVTSENTKNEGTGDRKPKRIKKKYFKVALYRFSKLLFVF